MFSNIIKNKKILLIVCVPLLAFGIFNLVLNSSPKQNNSITSSQEYKGTSKISSLVSSTTTTSLSTSSSSSSSNKFDEIKTAWIQEEKARLDAEKEAKAQAVAKEAQELVIKSQESEARFKASTQLEADAKARKLQEQEEATKQAQIAKEKAQMDAKELLIKQNLELQNQVARQKQIILQKQSEEAVVADLLHAKVKAEYETIRLQILTKIKAEPNNTDLPLLLIELDKNKPLP